MLYVFDVDGKKLAVMGNPLDIKVDAAKRVMHAIYPQARFLYYVWISKLKEHGPRYFLLRADFQAWLYDKHMGIAKRCPKYD